MIPMNIYHYPAECVPDGRYGATIGFFDGVHRGHQFLLGQLREECSSRGLKSMVITFDRAPRQVLDPTFHPQLLTTLKEKEEAIRILGVDELVVVPFNRETASLSAQAFMREILSEKLGVDITNTNLEEL